ncbi:hypothetical protein Tco_0880365 [Tanacetum coccineum]
MKESEAYKTYHDLATGKVQPKPKYVHRSSRTNTDEAPKSSFGKRVKATAKVAKSGKKKQPAPGLETLSNIALTKAEQMKLAIKRSKTQLHISQPNGSGAHEGTGKSSEEEDDDEDFVHPKFSTHDDEAKQDEEVHEDDSFDPRVQTPSHVESTDDKESNEVTQDANVEGDMINEEETHEEVEANVLYRDVNVNLEGRDTLMTDVLLPNVQATQETEDTHVTLTALINPEGQQQSSSVLSGFVSNMLNPRPDTCIDSIFNLNNEVTSLVDVPVTTIAEPPLVFATTLPPPPTPLITHMQQTPVPTPTIVLSSSLQDIPNFGSLFGFDHRLKTLETEFSEFKQTNQFAKTVSSIPGIVDAYLANKMNEVVKTDVQLQSNRLIDEAQGKNEDFLNKLDENIKKIIKDQVKEQVKAQVSKILPRIEKTVNEQLEDEVMTRSTTESKKSLAIAANLSELELKKILIEKMESNKSIHRSNEQKNLYKALVEAYKSDKLILNTYGDTVSFKRCKDDEDKDEEPSAGSNWGSKRRRARKEPESTDESKSQHKSAGESAHTEEPMHTNKDLEEPAHQEFDIGATEEQSDEETSQHPDWFQKPAKIPTLDHGWNKTLHVVHGPVQPWLSNLARIEGPRESFDELLDTPLDFSAFMMNRFKIDTLTPELLVGPTFELIKGTCKSLVELEYFFKEVYKATTDQLDWHNPEGQQYPHDLRKPLPLIPNSRGRQVIPFDQFINNDLAYLSGGVSSRTYATSVTKTKAADYGHIKWIEDLIPNIIWSEVPVNYDKESAHDVYSKHRIIAVTKLQIVEWHGYKHLDWITVRRDDDKLYTFKEGDFKRLRLQDIEDMLILLVQGKLTNLNVEDRLAFGVSLRMFTRSIVIQRRVEDLQLGVESYQKKLNITKCRNPINTSLHNTNQETRKKKRDDSLEMRMNLSFKLDFPWSFLRCLLKLVLHGFAILDFEPLSMSLSTLAILRLISLPTCHTFALSIEASIRVCGSLSL